MNNHSTYNIKGKASYLLFGQLIEDNSFDSIELHYEEQFENIFFYFKETDILRFYKNPALEIEGTKLSISVDSWGSPLMDINEIDAIFWSNNEEKLQILKNTISELIKDKDFDLIKRENLTPILKI